MEVRYRQSIQQPLIAHAHPTAEKEGGRDDCQFKLPLTWIHQKGLDILHAYHTLFSHTAC